jgi:D-amino-acid dehydrogenase
LWRVFGWIADPLGPLSVRPSHAPKLLPWLMRFAKAGTPSESERISKALAAINLRAYDDLGPMLRAMGLADELHRYGALTVYESEQGYRRDTAEWACKRSRGIIIQDLTAADAREREPALGPRIHRAVFTPQWSHVSDPKHLVDGLRNWLLARGVVSRRGEVQHIIPGSGSALSLKIDGETLRADRVVIAAGAWSGALARQLGERVLLESERGYNMTLPEPGISVHGELIFAERKFVATPLSCGLRIGGAAEFGGLNAIANFKRSHALIALARQYLPGLKTEGGTCWAGHRPATPDSLPVIGRSKRHANMFYAFGHGHLGLTQAATTGKLISELIMQKSASIDVTPYGIERFHS